MQGIRIDGLRPKSKKDIKDALKNGKNVYLEATSPMGREYDGNVKDMPDSIVYFVGPDPFTKRTFYGKVVKSGDKITVT